MICKTDEMMNCDDDDIINIDILTSPIDGIIRITIFVNCFSEDIEIYNKRAIFSITENLTIRRIIDCLKVVSPHGTGQFIHGGRTFTF